MRISDWSSDVCSSDLLESIGDTEHSLGTAEIEEAVGRHDLSNATQHLALGGLVEVDQHVAAEHHVELPEHRRIVEQIERLVGDHAADFLADAPLLAFLGEMLHQQSDRQAALHLELRVEAFLCLLQDRKSTRLKSSH